MAEIEALYMGIVEVAKQLLFSRINRPQRE
jgi:hypothetical protein